MINIDWRDFPDAQSFEASTAQHVSQIIAAALFSRGRSSISLAGGKTPAPIFARLAKMAIDWPKVCIVPSDDRLVGPNDPLSNVSMIKRALSHAAQIRPLIADSSLPYLAAGEAADTMLQRWDWPLDLVWLGMGNDGHTASLLPGPDLDGALSGPSGQRAVGVLPDPLPAEAPVPRVTLSGSAILEARALLLTITGAEKRKVLKDALRDGASSKTPVGRLLARTTAPVVVHWRA